MPVCTSIHREYPDKNAYPAPKKYVLVLSCVDYRLLDDLIRFLDHDNLTNRYYHVALAGAALGVVPKSKSGPHAPAVAEPHWRETFRAQVRAAVHLTHGELTDIYIVQHEQCGAFLEFLDGFKELQPSEQEQVNEDYARALLTDVRDNFCHDYNARHELERDDAPPEKARVVQEKPPAVHAFYMDLRGNVRLIDSYVPLKDAKCENYLCHCAPLPVLPVAPPPREVPPTPADTPAARKTTRKANK